MRLIDADELMEHVWRDKLDSRELIAKMIDDAPTVKEISTKIPINVFEQLISQEPKTRHWIPVSERMPNFSDIVLASTDSDYDELKVILTVYEGEEFWFNGKIKAWMPLPKPYKAESE